MNQRQTRVAICGAVDHGKSTLLAQLMLQLRLIPDDTLRSFEGLFKKETFEISSLVDGLAEETSENITIETGYKYCAFNEENFVFIDAPGHEKYRPNTLSALTQGDFILFVIEPHTELSSTVLAQLEICATFVKSSIIFAINKLDQFQYSEKKFLLCQELIKTYFDHLNFKHSLHFVPISALKNENIITKSPRLNWYSGSTLFELLCEKKFVSNRDTVSALEIQGTKLSSHGRIFYGISYKSKCQFKKEFVNLRTGEFIIARDEVTPKIETTYNTMSFFSIGSQDITRGDILIQPSDAEIWKRSRSKNISCKCIFFAEFEAFFDSAVLLQIGTRSVSARLLRPELRESISTLKQHVLNVSFELENAIPVLPYESSTQFGSFQIIDPKTMNTIGLGAIINSQPLFESIHLDPFVAWLAGPIASGKSTLAKRLSQRINVNFQKTIVLDADDFRKSLNSDLGFTDNDKLENVRRLACVAAELNQQGFNVIVAAVTPTEACQNLVYNSLQNNNLFFCLLTAPLQVCMGRDYKEIYLKAQQNINKNVPLIDCPYENAGKFDIVLDSGLHDPNTLTNMLLAALKAEFTPIFKIKEGQEDDRTI